MVLLETKIKFLKLTKRPWVKNDYIPNKQRFILLLETKQRFPMLKGTKNAFRIFIVLSETKSALVIKISQLYCLFAVWNSDVFSICFFGQHDSFRKLFWGFVRHKALKFPLDHGKHAHDRRCLSDSWSWVVVPEVDLWRTLLRTVGCEVHQTVIKTSKYGQNCKYYPHKSF